MVIASNILDLLFDNNLLNQLSVAYKRIRIYGSDIKKIYLFLVKKKKNLLFWLHSNLQSNQNSKKKNLFASFSI